MADKFTSGSGFDFAFELLVLDYTESADALHFSVNVQNSSSGHVESLNFAIDESNQIH